MKIISLSPTSKIKDLPLEYYKIGLNKETDHLEVSAADLDRFRSYITLGLLNASEIELADEVQQPKKKKKKI